ncbi:MAG: ATP-dependent RNA helicase HrpA [Magnetococcales bacterium]|nr:ATP-dependent RNA helicase HrpA [Magnetococcales bacterium]
MTNPPFKKLFRTIAGGLICDQISLRQRLRALEQQHQKGDAITEALAAWQTRLTASCQKRTQRLASLPIPHYPDDLPVAQNRQQIAEAIQKHPVVILCGETGSGKTTQLPKICLDLQRGTGGWIGMTQPRRIAARSIADFLAQDLHSEIGAMVGYKMRFTDRVSPDSLLKVMTDGILLAEIQSDRQLSRYDTLIIDEAHERSLNIDFILGYLKQLSPRRPDLKIIISSATLDIHRIARHFGNAPAIEISGRTFPVETRYRPLRSWDAEAESEEKDLEQGVLEAVQELYALGPSGDILVFLPGEREIREVGDELRKQLLPQTEILPLFARLSMADQHRIFYPGAKRRIILATNVAETSLTVPGIRYVIDSGLARISRHSGRTQVRRLPVEKISRAAANQRQGRCGRLADGVCIRLFSQEEFLAREEFTDPEILRVSLAAVILQMKFLKLGEMETFPFVDPPGRNAIQDGLRLLAELGALTERGLLTPLGSELAQLPLDPRLGRMVLAGRDHGCLAEMLIIVSALSLPDPREWPAEQRGKAELAHKRHLDPQSDFVGLLTLWTFIETGRQEVASNNAFRRYLKENFLSVIRVREWQGIHEQLTRLVGELGLTSNQAPASFMEIHKAILSGSLGFIGFKTENHDYIGVQQHRFSISPGSALFKKSPTWVAAGELVETTRLFASTCARVEPEWIEAVAGRLCRQHHQDPHWEKKSGCVLVFERVTLFGLTLIAQRKVQFGPLDPKLARQIFIQGALVEGEMQTSAVFFAHNQGLIAEVRELEHKSRRKDLLVDEQDLYAFYDQQIPDSVHSTHLFHQWYWQARKRNPRLLFFTRDMLLRHGGEGITGESFPGHLLINGLELSLEYHFNPGAGEDGISVHVPLPYLNQLAPPLFEWLVPGLLADKLLALLKALPKTLRRPLVPLPQALQYCLENIQETDRSKPLGLVLGHLLMRRYGVVIPAEAWRFADLPDHLRINFKITDEKADKILAQGRDLLPLQQQWGVVANKSFSKLPKADFERSGLTRWDFGDLPQQVVVSGETGTTFGFPAIQDDETSVSLRLVENAEQARQISRWGLVRLFALQLPQQVRPPEKKRVLQKEKLTLHPAFGPQKTLWWEITALAVARVFLDGSVEEIETEAVFLHRLAAGRGILAKAIGEMQTLVQEIIQRHRLVVTALQQGNTPGWAQVAGEMQAHVEALLYPGFLRETPPAWLKQYPRYLQAILLRLERRAFAPAKDVQKAAELAPWWQRYQTVAKKHAAERVWDPELQHYRWMVEEFRVSLFAQDLRTAVPVSAKRLELQWEKVMR